jgi:dGTPase
VTQVVAPAEGHIFHNRLTHTLEVAQIARRTAEYLCKNHDDEAKHFGLNPDIVEAAALAHDLGHPPFGHVAEVELNKLVKKTETGDGLFDGYEGNAQSFRIVTKLAIRRDGIGLDLSRACLDAILKYPWFHGTSVIPSKKWGAYRSEEEDFNWARGLHQNDNHLPSLEAEVMTWADDIAYSIHDTEDFYRAGGLIPLADLAEPQEAKRFLDGTFERWQREDLNTDANTEDLRKAFESLSEFFPAVPGVFCGSREQRASLRTWTSTMIGRYVKATSLEPTPDLTRPYDGTYRYLKIDKQFLMEIEMLKELTWHYVIKNPALATQQHGHRTIVKTLFEIFSSAVYDGPKRWHIFPASRRDDLEELYKEQGNAIPSEERLRIVADTIAGMSDNEAVRIYNRLLGTCAGSVFDPIVR